MSQIDEQRIILEKRKAKLLMKLTEIVGRRY